jgi:hypothetical protein
MELSLAELLAKIETAAQAIETARKALNDTGDYESDELDKATTLTEQVARLIDRAYTEANQ